MTSTNNWAKVINSSVNSTKMLGIAMGGNPATDGVLLRGFVRDITYGFSGGTPLYISSSSGLMSNSVGVVGSGDYARLLGYCVDTTTRTIYFNPEPVWI